MVGGSSRIPMLTTMLKNYFGENIVINNSVDPDTVVAHGATIMAGILSGSTDLGIVLNDVTPMTLGLSIQHEKKLNFIVQLFKDKQFVEKMEKMIPRNSAIPV